MRRTAVAGLVGFATLGILASASIAVAASVTAWLATPGSRAPAAAAAPLDDATIVAIFDAANTADIETGRLAAERGNSTEVREFGAMLARDHETVRQMGRDLAKKLGVTPTPPADDRASKDQAAALARLRGLSGQAFDAAFLRHEAGFHKGVIDAVQTTLLPAIQNAELKALVVKVAPAFQGHMLAAEQLEKKLAGASGRAARGGR
jgi:putative membrane protein